MSASPPTTATKRAASPLSPDTAQGSKRIKEETQNKEDGEAEDGTAANGSTKVNGTANGNGNGAGVDKVAAAGAADTGGSAQTKEGGLKMEDEHMDGAATPSSAPSSSIPAAPAPAKVEQVQQISMRCLIVTQDASIIIGRAGVHVNEIREKSSARVNVSESIPGNPERILSVSGQLDAVAKAFGLIVRRINDEPFDVASVPGSRAVTIKFIIPNSRMGSVIGKAGSKIKEIQEASGARLNASEAMLPGSTERVLSVSGVADAIHIAVYYIGTILLEYQDRNPGQSSGQYRQQSGGGGGSGDRRSGPGGGGPGFGGGPGGPGGSTYAPGQPVPGAHTQQIFIPNSLVGAIIGKGGAKINEIRAQSGCQVRVADPGTPAQPGQPANPEERLVTITGHPQAINVAVSMLYQRLEAEKQKSAAL